MISPAAALLALVMVPMAVMAADPGRVQGSTSSAPRATATPAPQPPPPQAVAAQRTIDQAYAAVQQGRGTSAPPVPTATRASDKPAYQFTQVAPRSLW